MQEQQDMIHDINDVLAEPVLDMDEDELMAELNELEVNISLIQKDDCQFFFSGA